MLHHEPCPHPQHDNEDLPCAWPGCPAGTGLEVFSVLDEPVYLALAEIPEPSAVVKIKTYHRKTWIRRSLSLSGYIRERRAYTWELE